MEDQKILTNKQKVFEFLKKAGPSSVKKIAQEIGLEERKARNVVTADYTGTFVYVGDHQYDLVAHALVGVKFRYYPTKTELAKGTLSADPSLVDFLLLSNYQGSITFTDPAGRNYLVKYQAKRRKKGKYDKSGLYSLKKFFKDNKISLRDGLVFTILDFQKRHLKVERISNEQPKMLIQANQYIADLLYQILKGLMQKNDLLLFLNRRLVPFYRKTKTAADLPEKIASQDERFILYDFLAKKPILNRRLAGKILGVGIKKYAVCLPNSQIGWVAFEKDWFGTYGFCIHCGIPLSWHPEKGWQHPKKDVLEYKVAREEVELDKEFFKRE